MKFIYIILLTSFSVLVNAQTDSIDMVKIDFNEDEIIYQSNHDLINWELQQLKSDTLLIIASKLNGLWVLDGHYFGEKFVTDTISSKYSKNGHQYEILTDSGTYYSVIKEGRAIFNKKTELNVIKLEFSNSTKGYYRRYTDYVLNREWQTMLTTQPVPEVVFHDNKSQILFTGLAGDNLTEFIIKGNELEFIYTSGLRKHYTRLTE